MLKFAGYKMPDSVYVHGFITVSGEKMSKSRGTGISPLRYLDIGMNPEWLRYYIAAKLNANVEDIDFNPDDFMARVNSDLVGKYVNIASRCAGFMAKRFRRATVEVSQRRRMSCRRSCKTAAPIRSRNCLRRLANIGKCADATIMLRWRIEGNVNLSRPRRSPGSSPKTATQPHRRCTGHVRDALQCSGY